MWIPKRRAFALGEILIVLLIMALLSIILLGLMARSRQNDWHTCYSNCEVLGIAFMTYERDYDDRLPNVTSGPNGGAGVQGGWVYFTQWPYDPATQKFDVTRGSLYPYIQQQRFYICPSDRTGTRQGESYSYNGCLQTTTKGTLMLGKKLSAFHNSTDWILLTEEDADPNAGPTDGGSGTTDDGYFNPFSNTEHLPFRHYLYHSKGVNVVYLDGHYKFTSIERIRTANLFVGGQRGLTACPK